MKKTIFAVSAVLIAACCSFAGCSLTPETPPEEDEYAFLNEMLKVSYSQIVLTVENDFGGDTLESKYTIVYGENVTVTYTIEEFAPLSSAEDIVTKAGKATIAGGEVVSTEGDDIGISAAVTALPFDFKENYFENADLTGGYLSADVKEADAFLGSGAAGVQDVHLEATFFETFYTLKLSYKDTRGSVRVSYEFTL